MWLSQVKQFHEPFQQFFKVENRALGPRNGSWHCVKYRHHVNLFLSFLDQSSVFLDFSDWALIRMVSSLLFVGLGADWQRNVAFYSQRLWADSVWRSVFSPPCIFPSATVRLVWKSTPLFNKENKPQTTQQTFLAIILFMLSVLLTSVAWCAWCSKQTEKPSPLLLFISFDPSSTYVSRMINVNGTGTFCPHTQTSRLLAIIKSEIWFCLWKYQ